MRICAFIPPIDSTGWPLHFNNRNVDGFRCAPCIRFCLRKSKVPDPWILYAQRGTAKIVTEFRKCPEICYSSYGHKKIV